MTAVFYLYLCILVIVTIFLAALFGEPIRDALRALFRDDDGCEIDMAQLEGDLQNDVRDLNERRG